MGYGVLIVEDEAVLAANIARFLDRHGYETRVADSAEDALAVLDTFRPRTIVLDYNLPGMNGLQFLARARASDPRVKLIMTTGHGSEQIAVDAMKAGAFDYLPKPLALGRLKLIVDQAARQDDEVAGPRYFERPPLPARGRDRLIGTSPPMLALKERIDRLLLAESGLQDSALPAVLVTGETGTGKELVSRAIHLDGVRRDGPFVDVNCSSIPAQLLEAELFGYERGAFTDAKARKAGLIEAADGGTLFLDELGEMDVSLQAKLLRFLEDRTIRPLGSVREKRANVRIVAATNRNLEDLVRAGRFRSDLYFRLRIMHLELPPLRSMRDDISGIAGHFLRTQSERYGKPGLAFTPAALELLERHEWPGNVRELRNVVEQAVILATSAQIDAEHLYLATGLSTADPAPSRLPAPSSGASSMRLEEVERELLSRALAETAWNVTRAARLLGLTRDALRYRIEKYRLRLPD